MLSVPLFTAVIFATGALSASIPAKRWEYQQYYDLQGHRGGRGEAVENTLWSFGWGLIHGVTTLEMDNGITADGEVVVWHDENIDPTKCKDTAPVYASDPSYPYVGKYIANLTLAQIKTLDCGSERLAGFPLQVTKPGLKIATLQEMFDFVKCATDEPVLFNIESKLDGDYANLTRGPEDFVNAQLAIFKKNDAVDRITYQSFDWRTIILSKKVLPELRTVALCDDTTLYAGGGNLTSHKTGPSNWLAGIDIDTFNGTTIAERVVQAAHSIGADILSPVATSYATPSTALDPSNPAWIGFTNATMVKSAHALGMQVVPWTPDRLEIIKYLLDIGVDGLITDFPEVVRRYMVQRGGYKLAPKANEKRVMKCLDKYAQYAPTDVTV